jgi:phosphoserine phosphatase RsbU/P
VSIASPADPLEDEAAREHLANLQALTDSTLAQLDVDELLRELLNRVRQILDVDTAAVLTLDRQSSELVARVACGIEEEVRQGVRVTLGAGFAGRIAATRAPVRLDRVDSTTVTNPILWEKGIKAMLGVPLQTSAGLIGVLHVGRLDNRPFTDREVELLQVVSDRVAGAVQARQLAIERAATNLLERSLLPGKLPVCDGLSFATRFAAAEQHTVGGDWYDLYVLPSGQLWITVGDVAGHGLDAAVTMGRIRSALRAYTMLDLPPERVLDLVDRKVRHFEIGTIVTVLCAVLDPPFDIMRVAVAGHLPPIIARPGRDVEVVDVITSPPVGAPRSPERRAMTVDVAHGSVVAFYTDGLIERRGESLDVGLERLRQAVELGSPDAVARSVMQRLIGSTSPRDDVALVVLHRA